MLMVRGCPLIPSSSWPPRRWGSLGLCSVLRFLQQLIRPTNGQAGSPRVKPEPMAVQISMPVQGSYPRVADSCCHWEPKDFGATSALPQGGIYSSTFCRILQTCKCWRAALLPVLLHIAGAAQGCDPLWVPSPYLAGGFVDTQAVQERRAARHAVQGTQHRTGGCDVLVAAFLAGCQKLSRAGQRG